MYLPGGPWYKIEKFSGEVEHFAGKKPLLLNCRGKCHREKRPLSCRLFPLAPYMDREGKLKVILDDDALFLCPLVREGDLGLLDPSFCDAVLKVWEELLKDQTLSDAVREYSARVDRQSKEPWRLFLK